MRPPRSCEGPCPKWVRKTLARQSRISSPCVATAVVRTQKDAIHPSAKGRIKVPTPDLTRPTTPEGVAAFAGPQRHGARISSGKLGSVQQRSADQRLLKHPSIGEPCYPLEVHMIIIATKLCIVQSMAHS